MFLWALVLTRFNLSNCRRSSPEIPRLGALCALPALNLSAARATIPQTLAAGQEGRQKHKALQRTPRNPPEIRALQVYAGAPPPIFRGLLPRQVSFRRRHAVQQHTSARCNSTEQRRCCGMSRACKTVNSYQHSSGSYESRSQATSKLLIPKQPRST